MESNNVIYKSNKYSVLAEETYCDTDGSCFELRLMLNVLEVTISVTQIWIYTEENLIKMFSNMEDDKVENFFNKWGM